MKNHFSIEFQVSESEKDIVLGKLRNYFLKEGYVIQRESNSQIDFYSPLPILRREESLADLWINKIQVVADGTQIRLVCSLSRLKILRFIVIALIPITEIAMAVVFYLLKINPLIIILLLLSAIVSPIVGYFLIRLIYTNSVEYFGNEIQRIVG